jgi:hypothetical protein
MSAMAVLGLAIVAAPGRAEAALTEAQLKAGFVYNAAIFVEWPPNAVANQEVVIGIVVGGEWTQILHTLAGRRVNGRTIKIKPLRPEDDPRGCHILFVGRQDPRTTAELAERLGDAPVLTVGEGDDFTTRGGIVRLFMQDGTLRFEVNMTRAERARLRFSAKMLGLAKIVR